MSKEHTLSIQRTDLGLRSRTFPYKLLKWPILLEELGNVTTGLPSKCLLTYLNEVVTLEGRVYIWMITLGAWAGSHTRERM